jgi:hypothetical protein
MNWVGKHSVLSDRYYQITYFSRHDEAPAFNLVFRILAPVVFLIVTAAILYVSRLDRFVDRLYMVVVYQQIIRWLYLILMGRGRLVRWPVQVSTAVVTVVLAWLAYEQILVSPTRLLPDFDNISGELWIIVLLFLYKMVDRVYTPVEGNAKRKEQYLVSRFEDLRSRYGHLIANQLDDGEVESLVYAVMIYETFNRPRTVRWIETWVGLWRGAGFIWPNAGPVRRAHH